MTIPESLAVSIALDGLEETLNRLFQALMEQCGPESTRKIFVGLVVASSTPKPNSQPGVEA